MIWVSGGRLAAGAANAGALGVLGAGSMKVDVLRQQIVKAKSLTNNPLAVNLPLLYEGAQQQAEAAIELGIRVFITSAGSPKKFTPFLKANNCLVVHVTSTPDLARKCEDAGVDAIVAEGFEAGGHNGRDEITTMALIPQVVDAVKIPVIAAGGIADGRGIAAALALGASGVQIGSRFAVTQESRAHTAFKEAILKAGPTDTMLSLRRLVPVRLLKNKFYEQVRILEEKGASVEELAALLGKGRSRRGMHDGELDEGELEIGQVSAMIRDVPTCAELVARLEKEYIAAVSALPGTLV